MPHRDLLLQQRQQFDSFFSVYLCYYNVLTLDWSQPGLRLCPLLTLEYDFLCRLIYSLNILKTKMAVNLHLGCVTWLWFRCSFINFCDLLFLTFSFKDPGHNSLILLPIVKMSFAFLSQQKKNTFNNTYYKENITNNAKWQNITLSITPLLSIITSYWNPWFRRSIALSTDESAVKEGQVGQ